MTDYTRVLMIDAVRVASTGMAAEEIARQNAQLYEEYVTEGMSDQAAAGLVDSQWPVKLMASKERRTVNVSLKMTPTEAARLSTLAEVAQRTPSDVIRVLVSAAQVDSGARPVELNLYDCDEPTEWMKPQARSIIRRLQERIAWLEHERDELAALVKELNERGEK